MSASSSIRSGQNVDPGEIARFAAAANDWWNLQGEFRPLHDINPVRLRYVSSRAELADCQALDVGCGGGILTEALARAGARTLGVDLAEASLQVATAHARDSSLANVSYRCIAIEQLADEAPGQYDVITCMEMLEHVPSPDSVVTACARLLRPGGRAFFSTINRNPKSYLMAIVGAEYILNLIPKGTHQYGKLIRPAELARWLRQAGLELEEMQGLHYNPLTRQAWLNDDVSVNYLLTARRPE